MINFITLLLALFTVSASPKPRFVDIAAELKRAPIVTEAIISSYTDSTVAYTPLTDNFSPGTLRFKRLYPMPTDANQLLTGCSPTVGDTLLIVADTTGRVSLFAEIGKTDYRFWSPYFTGSVAHFLYTAPFTNITGRKEELRPNGDKFCWDGCQLKKDLLGQYVKGVGGK